MEDKYPTKTFKTRCLANIVWQSEQPRHYTLVSASIRWRTSSAMSTIRAIQLLSRSYTVPSKFPKRLRSQACRNPVDSVFTLHLASIHHWSKSGRFEGKHNCRLRQLKNPPPNLSRFRALGENVVDGLQHLITEDAKSMIPRCTSLRKLKKSTLTWLQKWRGY